MWSLPRLCKDAGLKVYAKASKRGRAHVEYSGRVLADQVRIPFCRGCRRCGGRTYRRSLRDAGPALEENVLPKAKYVSSSVQLKPSSTFVGTAYRVEDRGSGALLGELVTYSFLGGWAERLLGGFSDSGPGTPAAAMSARSRESAY